MLWRPFSEEAGDNALGCQMHQAARRASEHATRRTRQREPRESALELCRRGGSRGTWVCVPRLRVPAHPRKVSSTEARSQGPRARHRREQRAESLLSPQSSLTPLSSSILDDMRGLRDTECALAAARVVQLQLPWLQWFGFRDSEPAIEVLQREPP